MRVPAVPPPVDPASATSPDRGRGLESRPRDRTSHSVAFETAERASLGGRVSASTFDLLGAIRSVGFESPWANLLPSASNGPSVGDGIIDAGPVADNDL